MTLKFNSSRGCRGTRACKISSS